MPMIFRGVSHELRKKQALKMLQYVGLKDRVKHKPTQMSGGQQQRVGIARAFVAHPPVIFADEPTGNLDTHTTYEVMDMMSKMVKERNATMIIVTHDNEIAEYGDHIIKIRDGKFWKKPGARRVSQLCKPKQTVNQICVIYVIVYSVFGSLI